MFRTLCSCASRPGKPRRVELAPMMGTIIRSVPVAYQNVAYNATRMAVTPSAPMLNDVGVA